MLIITATMCLLLAIEIKPNITNAQEIKPKMTFAKETKPKLISRVIEGEDTTDYPYVGVICLRQPEKILFTRTCTGSYISTNWFITAAHCVHPVLLSYNFIRYGDVSLPPENNTWHRNVLKAVTHPAYKQRTLHNGKVMMSKNDIALLKTEPVVMQSFGMISSVDYKALVGRPVHYIGGGTLRKEWYEMDNTDQIRHVLEVRTKPLQIGHAVVIACPRDAAVHTLSMLCLQPKCSQRSTTPFPGDSGGPLLYRGKIVGVCSTGSLRVGRGVHYTPTSRYLDWVVDVMSKES